MAEGGDLVSRFAGTARRTDEENVGRVPHGLSSFVHATNARPPNASYDSDKSVQPALPCMCF